jgi:hypothetical protein
MPSPVNKEDHPETAELHAMAVAMIDAPADEVWSLLTDYETARAQLATGYFGDYELLEGGEGAGTEVAWSLKIGAQGRRKRKFRHWDTWHCQVRVDEPGKFQFVERDTGHGLVTEWTVRPTGDTRSAVHIAATWPGRPGLGAMVERARQRLAVRAAYEDLLNQVHDYFAPPEEEEEDSDAAET